MMGNMAMIGTDPMKYGFNNKTVYWCSPT
jgi:hypothetical protein